MNERFLSEGGVQRDERDILFHAAVSGDEPFGPGFSKNRNVLLWLPSKFPQTSTKVFGFFVHLRKRAPLIVAKNQLVAKRLIKILNTNDYSFNIF